MCDGGSEVCWGEGLGATGLKTLRGGAAYWLAGQSVEDELDETLPRWAAA